MAKRNDSSIEVSADDFFAVVPEWVLATTSRAVHLYAVLRRYADTNNQAWPSRATLARRLNCSRSTIDRALAALEAAGAITIQHRVSDDGDQATNLYTVHSQPFGGGPLLDKGGPSMKRGGPLVNRGVVHPRVGGGPLVTHRTKAIEPEPEEPLEASHADIKSAILQALRWEPDDVTSWGPIDKAAKLIRGTGADPAEVARRANNWPLLFPDATLTPSALAKHWPALDDPTPPRGRSRAQQRLAELADWRNA